MRIYQTNIITIPPHQSFLLRFKRVTSKIFCLYKVFFIIKSKAIFIPLGYAAIPVISEFPTLKMSLS